MIRCWMKLRSDNCNVTNSLCVRLGGGGMAFLGKYVSIF